MVGKFLIKVDYHTHILHHGVVPMIKSAMSNSIKSFGITEHISQFRKPREDIQFSSYHKNGVVFENFKNYFEQFELLGDNLPASFDLKQGLEVDYIRKHESKLANFVGEEKWGIILCAVHEFEGVGGVERPGYPQDVESSFARWREYIHAQIDAIESSFVQKDVLAHPVRLVVSTPVYPKEIDEMLGELATAARKNGVAIELNGRDYGYDNNLVRKLAIACGRVMCKVSLGSDAHYADDVYRNNSSIEEIISSYALNVLI